MILPSSGSIVGGTIVDQGSGVKFQGGTLSGVIYDGTLDLSPSSSSVYIANSLTANNLAGTGAGTINLTGYGDSIYFEGNQTFNNATINLGSTSGYYDTIYNYDTNNTGSVLTLGPNVIVNQAVNETSGYAELYSAGYNHAGDGIVNQGTINAQAVNGSFYIEPYNFTNQGTINVTNGDKLYIEPTTFTNNGIIAISGGTADITTAVLGTGNFTINGGTLELGAASAETVMFAGPTGTFELQHSLTALFTGDISGLAGSSSDVIDLADLTYTNEQPTYNAATGVLTVTEGGGSVSLQLINYTGSSIFTASSDGNGGTNVVVSANQGNTTTINSPLTNTGQTLTAGAGSGTIILASGGSIVGGTIVDQGSGVEFQGGTLSGVTYDGTLNLSPYDSTVYITTGLTANNLAGTGPGTINLTGEYDSIYFEGNQTFNNATINLGNTSGYYDYIYNDDTNNAGSVLTLGPKLIVDQATNETLGYAVLELDRLQSCRRRDRQPGHHQCPGRQWIVLHRALQFHQSGHDQCH